MLHPVSHRKHGHEDPSVRQSVVGITVRDLHGNVTAHGSGVVVGWNVVATSWSLVKGAHTVTANFVDGRSCLVYGIVGSDRKHNVVIVWAETGHIKPHIDSPTIRTITPKVVTRVMQWGDDEWRPVTSRGIDVGSLAIVVTDKTPITKWGTGQVLSTCPKGMYLDIGEGDNDFYRVLMVDGTIGAVAKQAVKLKDKTVYQNVPLPLYPDVQE